MADHLLCKKFLQKIVADGDSSTLQKIMSSLSAENDPIDSNNLLHFAIQLGRDEIVKVLVSSGAYNLKEKNPQGSTALHLALKVLLFVEENGTQKKSQDAKIPVEYLAILKTLLDAGADVNAKGDQDGATPLHYAALLPRYEIYLALARRGALNSRPDVHGNTPLHKAVGCQNNRLVEALVADGARLRIKNKEGRTPTQVSLSRVNLETTKVLIYAGAEVNSTGRHGQTALHLASWKSDLEFVEYLVARGADVNAKDCEDLTPLHWAVMYSSDESKPRIVELLLRNQADPRIRDVSCKKPIEYLDEGDRVYELLRSHENKLPDLDKVIISGASSEVVDDVKPNESVRKNSLLGKSRKCLKKMLKINLWRNNH